MKKLSLALSICLLPCSLWAAEFTSEVAPFAKEDYQLLKVDFKLSKVKTMQNMLDAIDKTILETAATLKNPWTRDQVMQSMEVILANNLPYVPNLIAKSVPERTVLLGEMSSENSITHSVKDGSTVLLNNGAYNLVYLNSRLKVTPLRLRLIALHEALGHLPHYMNMYTLVGAENIAAHFANAEFTTAFNRFSHASTALLELQFYRAVPKKYMINEIKASGMPSPDQVRNIQYLNRQYSFSPHEFMKEHMLDETCKSGEKCISDEEFNSYFIYFRSLGFNFL